MMKSVEGLVLSVESSWPSFSLRSRSALFPALNSQRSTLNPPRGVTLIELLVTIMIISILAAAVLGVAAVAGETAREAKTRTIISRIHTLLMQQYDSYTSRRVRVWPEIIDQIGASNASTAAKGRMKAQCRLNALREMMLTELPDRWSDVLLEDLPPSNPNVNPPKSTVYLAVPETTRRTEIGAVYLRTYRRIANAQNKLTGTANTTADILANQSAECLYLVIMNACGDGESRTLFPESSIADTDGDGAPEFVDGWGHPIEFIRWAPGLESDIQVNANDFGAAPVSNPASIPEWVSAAAGDHDPFDLYRTDQPAFRLMPLVYSLGRDEEAGLLALPAAKAIWAGVPNVHQTINLASPPTLLPWAYVSDGSNNYYAGTADPITKASTDNLTNHLIGTRLR